MATVDEIVQNTRDIINEQVISNWTNSQIKRWINDGLKDLARRTESWFKTATVPGVAGTQSYTAPADVLKINRVEWITSGSQENIPLEFRDFHNMDAVWWTRQTTVSGRPALFTTWGYGPNLTITLYPKPSEAGTIKIFYYGLPAAIVIGEGSDLTVIDIPLGWDSLLTEFCTYKAFIKDADPRWQEVKAEYEQHVEHMMERTRKYVDASGMIMYDRNYGLPGWLVNG